MNKVNKTQTTPSLQFMHVLIAAFYLLTLLVHLLVITTIIPYQWVNGGMSPSYEAQAVQSAVSIVVTGTLFLLVWKVANAKSDMKAWQKHALYALTGLLIIGFIMQLLGTSFERYAVSVLLLVGVVGHMQLIRARSRH